MSKQNNWYFLITLVIIFSSIPVSLKAQSINLAMSPNQSEENIASNETETADSLIYQLRLELTNKLEKILKDLNIYDVIVGQSPENQPLSSYDSIEVHSKLSHLSQINFAVEALVLSLLYFEQKQLSADSIIQSSEDTTQLFQDLKRPLWSSLLQVFRKQKSMSHKSSQPVQTHLSVMVQLVLLDSGQVIDTFYVDVVHLGQQKTDSKVGALEQFQKMAHQEVKKWYRLFSEVVAAENNEITLLLGKTLDVRQNNLYELIEPNRFVKSRHHEYTVPGKRIGFARIKKVTEDSSQAQVVRQWRPLQAGTFAVSCQQLLGALLFDYYLPTTDSYFRMGGQIAINPLLDYELGFDIHYFNIVDSYQEKDHGVGFGFSGLWRFRNRTRYDLGTKLGLDMEIPFKKDDDGRTVNTLLVSAQLGLTGEFLVTSGLDFIINIGYRVSNKNSSWSYSEEEETIEAYWEDKPPSVRNTGFFLTVGLKILAF